MDTDTPDRGQVHTCRVRASGRIETMGYQTYQVDIDLTEAIDYNTEGFLDMICERAGVPLLMDISYSVRGCKANTITLDVTGDNSTTNTE
jgi:hypothetical protein